MTRTLILLSVLSLSGAGCLGSGSMRYSGYIGVWEPDVETKLSEGTTSDRIELVDDLDMDKDVGTVWYGEFAVHDAGGRTRPAARYNFGFWSLNQRNTNFVSSAFDFDGETFTGDVRTRFTATNYYFSGEAPSNQPGKVQGGIFGVHLLNVEMELEEMVSGDSAEMSKWLPMPVIGYRTELKMGEGFSMYLLAEGMNLAIFDIESFDAEFWHLDTGIKIQLAKHMSIAGGYKTWQYTIGLDDDYVKMEMDGATLVFEFSF